jgi:DNA-binding LacI/PurR family transcriptional regulator
MANGPAPAMYAIPQRVSLVAQTVASLRQGLADGLWHEHLPGELELCERLQVSRMTLRRALAVLEGEGLLVTAQGQRRRIGKAAPAGPARRERRVVLLTPLRLAEMRPTVLYWVNDLTDHLAEAGFHLEVHPCPACYAERPEETLNRLERELRPAGWVLYLSTAAMQEWFSRQTVPALLAGSRHGDVRLPSVDLDYRAIGQHAAETFLAKGHRHLAFLRSTQGLAGDLETEHGFVEACGRHGARGEVLSHGDTPERLRQTLAQQLTPAARPTALLVSQPAHMLTVLGTLAQAGISVPGGVSLIARDSESFLPFLVPTVARYEIAPANLARNLSRQVLAMLGPRGRTEQAVRLMPKFVPGATLGNLSKARTTTSA